MACQREVVAKTEVFEAWDHIEFNHFESFMYVSISNSAIQFWRKFLMMGRKFHYSFLLLCIFLFKIRLLDSVPHYTRRLSLRSTDSKLCWRRRSPGPRRSGRFSRAGRRARWTGRCRKIQRHHRRGQRGGRDGGKGLTVGRGRGAGAASSPVVVLCLSE